jgi:hypothetical protein
VRVNGADVYKFSALANSQIFHAVKGQGEDRRLHIDTAVLDDQSVPVITGSADAAGSNKTSPSPVTPTFAAKTGATAAPARKPCGCGGKPAVAIRVAPVTRPSCLECVEKHMGAAWVLLAEHRDGYPHRLHAVGHLHEAEDESQEWTELHVAIREARKAYQRQEIMSDFNGIAQRLVELRHTASKLG